MTGLIDGIDQRFLIEGSRPKRGHHMWRVLLTVLGDERLMFSQTDLQRKNVLVSRDNMAYVIEWKSAAWYAPCCEYFRNMISFGHFEEGWHSWVGWILHESIQEFVWLGKIRQELW
jgi:hypothetical protein